MQYGLQRALDARVLYVDMNAFFASIEQLYNPELRDRPVAVVSHFSATGTVLASSYQAKTLGITTGTRLRDAMELCPDLKLRETNSALYKSVHRQLHQILVDTLGEGVEMRSIDEATVRLAPNEFGIEQATELADTVKDRIKQRLGESLRCSIGIAPNSLLAKVATDLDKPDGLFVIRADAIEQVLGGMELTDLPGIAHGNAAHLIAHGIGTPLEFYRAEAHDLRRWFGIWGQYWYWHLHGFEAPAEAPAMHNLSHEHVMQHWLHKKSEALPVIVSMADRLVHRLRRNNYQCRSVSVGLSLVGLPRHTAERRFDVPVSSYGELLGAVNLLVDGLPDIFPVAARKVTILLGGVTATQGDQLDMFKQRAEPAALSAAIQQIRERHGLASIQVGTSMLKTRIDLKEQPGFGRIRDAVVF